MREQLSADESSIFPPLEKTAKTLSYTPRFPAFRVLTIFIFTEITTVWS